MGEVSAEYPQQQHFPEEGRDGMSYKLSSADFQGLLSTNIDLLNEKLLGMFKRTLMQPFKNS